MKEDLAIARNSLLALQAENSALRQSSSSEIGNRNNTPADNAKLHDRIDPEMAELIAEEKKKRYELEKELDLQVSVLKFFPSLLLLFRFFFFFKKRHNPKIMVCFFS